MRYHAKYGGSSSKRVCKSIREPAKLGTSSACLGMEGVALAVPNAPKNKPLPICVIMPNSVVLSQAKEKPKNWEALEPSPCGRDATRMTCRNTPLHHVYYPAEVGRSRSSGTSVINRSA